jgi:hypothetical protein
MSEEKKEIKPIIPTLPGSPTYDSTLWGDTEAGKGALGSYNAAKDALNSQPGFSFSQNNWLNSVKNNIKNYGDFSYDFNADALYQQYKDRYIQQGKMAMADTIGQASAMTGGYGNSYAATVGNQAYQAHLNELNDVIPELYQLALERHNMGKQDLYNQYGLLMSEYEREYGKHSDEYNKLMDKLGIARSDYYDGADMFYKEQSNINNVAGQTFTDAMAIWNANNTNAWNQATWDRDEERHEESKLADSVGSTSTGGSGTTSTSKNYNNGNLSTEQVKELQVALGVEADGYYGEDSKNAAGGKSAADAWAAYLNGDIHGRANLMDFDRDTYTKNVQANNGSYEASVLADLKEFKKAGKTNKQVQSYLGELVAQSFLTGTEYSRLYNMYRNNELK